MILNMLENDPPPEFYDRIREALGSITFGDWDLLLCTESDRCYMQWCFYAVCPRTGKNELRRGRKWRLSPHMTKSELVQTALRAALSAVEHEAREKFLYLGRPVYGPHYDVDRLHELCGTDRATQVRA